MKSNSDQTSVQSGGALGQYHARPQSADYDFFGRVHVPQGMGPQMPFPPQRTQDIVLDAYTADVRGGDDDAELERECPLRSARSLLDRLMFEGDELRDDVANLCVRIDDVLPPLAEISVSDVTLEEIMNVAA